MKILFLTQWYAPEPDGRVSTLAEGLVHLGHEVTVITGFPNYPRGKIYDGYKIKWRQWEQRNGVQVLRLPLYPDHSHSSIKRAFNYLSFMLSLLFLAPWFIKKPNVIWSYTPFMTLPSIWIKKIFGSNFVMEITDIWPDTIVATGMMNDGLVMRLLNKLADIAYSHAAAITVQNNGFKPCLESRGADSKKIHIIQNWADEDVYFPVQYDSYKANEHGIENKFVVMFAGNMGFAQALDNVINAAKLCSSVEDIVFVFVGDGAVYADMKQRVCDENLQNVVFTGRKPAVDMPAFFSIADVMLVTLKDEALFDITLPAKTQSYLACGKPIIISKGGNDTKQLEESGCAIICEPENPRALADSVLKVFNMKKEERQAMGVKSLQMYEENYKKEKLLLKMEEVLKSAV